MQIELFNQRVQRNPMPYLKYLILDGARAGWVMPGSMLRTRGGGWGTTYLEEPVIPINPTVEVGDTVVPLRMYESAVHQCRVIEVQPKFIVVDGDMRGQSIEEWVVLPENLSDQDRELLFLQIREHLVLAGYEEESRRRGWNIFWKDVNEAAGFTPRPVPSVMQVRASWRVPRIELQSFMQADRFQDLVNNSDEVVMSHVTTDHTILLPNISGQCRCAEHARTHVIGTEVTNGPSYRAVSELLRVGVKNRMELHSITVRSLSCAYGNGNAF